MVGLEHEEHEQHGEHLGGDPGRECRSEELGEAAHLEQRAVARVLGVSCQLGRSRTRLTSRLAFPFTGDGWSRLLGVDVSASVSARRRWERLRCDPLALVPLRQRDR